MKRSLYIPLALLTASVALTSCSNDEDLLFEDSSANRLEAAKTSIAARLTADGGKWVMEYFANSNEPGYLMALQFGADGSVTAGANHKWFFNRYTSDNSLWEVIADDGPVLTFNTYNEVLHYFANPEDIDNNIYPDAPVNPDTGGGVNEVGKGHEGDYEFVVMEADCDDNNVRLLGKKRGYNIWLRRLPADTDLEAYLTSVKAVTDNLFSNRVQGLILTDGVSKERFVVNKAETGVMEVYPEAGDAVSQTVKRNYIITGDGKLRFMTPFSIPRADESAEDWVIETLSLNDDGFFVAEDGTNLSGPVFSEFLVLPENQWRADINSGTGKFSDLKNISAQVRAIRPTFTFSYLSLVWSTDRKQMTLLLAVNGMNSTNGRVYFDIERIDDNTVKFKFAEDAAHWDQAGSTYYKRIPAFKALIDGLCSSPVKLIAPGAYAPVSFKMSVTDDDAVSFDLR